MTGIKIDFAIGTQPRRIGNMPILDYRIVCIGDLDNRQSRPKCQERGFK
jgi:hypothetical protein